MRALKAHAVSAQTTNNASCMQNTLGPACATSSSKRRVLLLDRMLLHPWKHTLLDRPPCPRSLVAQKSGSAQRSYIHMMTAGGSSRRAQHTERTLASTPPDDPAVPTAGTNHTCDKLTSQQKLPPPAPCTQWVPWTGQVTHNCGNPARHQ